MIFGILFLSREILDNYGHSEIHCIHKESNKNVLNNDEAKHITLMKELNPM